MVGIRGQAGHDPTSKTVTSTSRVNNRFRWECWDHKNAIVAEQHGAMLTLFQDDKFRPKFANSMASTHEVGFAGQQHRFAVVKHQAIEAGKQSQKRILLMVNPEVHGIGNHQFG